jgi:ABC-2 type transport system ATP-binding protein
MPSSELAIDLQGISKRYRRVEALRGADLQVPKGQIFGLLGPNGAGKSTLVKILLTLVRPSGGGGTVLGRPLGDRGTLAKVGYLPENLRFPEYLTGGQALEYFGGLSKVPRRPRRVRMAELLDLVGMRRWADRPVRTYSKGMRQRVGLAAALVADPQLLVLDEPTDGVDPIGRKEIRDVLIGARRSDRSVLLNSHLLSEVESVCDRVAIMHQGRILRDGSVQELATEERGYQLEVGGASPLAADAVAWIAARGGRAEAGDAAWRLHLPGAEAEGIQPLIDLLRRDGRIVHEVRPVRRSLEDLFMQSVAAEGGGSAPGGIIRGEKAPPPAPPATGGAA